MSDRIQVAYRLRERPDRLAERAEALALEQSVEMPRAAVMDARVARDVIARVERVESQSDSFGVAYLSLAVETVGTDAGQLMNMLFGNSSLHEDIELVDVEVPPVIAAAFGGPALGIAGIRRMLSVDDRPLTCTALKPVGSTAADLERLTRVFAEAGIDVIKDDHGWGDHGSAGFRVRVDTCQRAIEASGRATTTLYAPNLSGTLDAMREQICFARERGVRAVLIAPMLVGVSNFHRLRREFPQIAFLAHPALAGHQIEPALLLGKLFRLFGADAVIFPNHGGRFSYSRPRCDAVADNLRRSWHGLAPSFPVPAGGMSVERAAELVAEYGRDTMLLIGGSLLAARERLAERSREFVAATAAAMREVVL